MLKMFSFDPTISAPQFRECDPPNFITTNKEQQFELLEMFYRQIGSLTELTYLDLRMEWKLSDDSVVWPCALAFKKTWFPALMTLGDAKTDRPGYLHLLEELGKLRELRGSFYVDTDEAKATMGEQEAAWVGLNWPCLKLAWFFHSRDSVRGPFKRLQDQRNQDSMDPNLRFYKG
ncbi:hypothetical protein BGX23_004877 [Mortierella sp. AD031]|nr:hypothetical protein BGX23_004877 [Mortierella sp. AD031]